ncbi:IPT/TIG domain-containing protein [Cryptosporangium sp. NPDC048952]|uniref:IPT/TIG domain-containing protein n=1 Tax=Cryptosporangium sp. NPDC048952 TaxID=3363961 RepID=UPI003710AA51
MARHTRARRTAAVVALLGTSALGVGALAAASPALAASAAPKASATPKATATPKASSTPKPGATPKPSATTKPSAKPTASVITITGLNSAYGNTAGGTNIVITGKGFSRVDPSNKSSVLFAKTPATAFLVLSDTQIAATAPAGTGTKIQISVTDGTNTSPDTPTDDFSYLDPITVAVPDKTSFSAAGGTSVRVTLTGKNLTLGTSQSTFAAKKITATVDGAPASLTWADATHVDLVAPAGTPSKNPAKVVIANNGVTGPADTAHAKYVAVVTKLSAVSGKVAGTTGLAGKPALTITGVGLSGATGFSIGSAKATCTAVSGKEDTTWTCANIPAGTAGAAPVQPTFADGRTAGVTAGSIYVYTDL